MGKCKYGEICWYSHDYTSFKRVEILRSGDVEKNPGPMRKKYTLKEKKSIHIVTILILSVIVISKLGRKTHKNCCLTSPSTLIFNLRPSTIFQMFLKRRKRNQCKLVVKNSSSYLLILLILAGDIHKNPGPEIRDICIRCKTEDKNVPTLTCETCHHWCHLNCTNSNKQHMDHILQASFEWICPLSTCKPNHYTSVQHANQVTICDQVNSDLNFQTKEVQGSNYTNSLSNRFTALGNADTEKQYQSKKIQVSQVKPKIKKQVTHTKKKSHLWSELTKISPKGYIGKEICNMCNNEITTAQYDMSCNTCKRYAHRKCSDMSLKVYKEEKEKLYQATKVKARSKNIQWKSNKASSINVLLKWNCLKCRTTDETNYTNFNETLCSEDQLPDKWDQIIKGKGEDEEIILHFNARSMVDKDDEIKEIARNMKPAAIFITESWFDESCPKGTAVPENYTIIRKDRSANFKQKYGKKNGGGVAVLIRKGVEIKEEPKFMNDQNEILWCTLKIKATKHLIGIIYRASYTELLKLDKDGNTEMEDLLQKTEYLNLMLIGDLNCDTAKPESTSETKTLLSLAEEYNLTNLIDKPTRFSEKTATIIDHIWVRESSLVRKAGTCDGISDHCGIYAYINALTPVEDEEITCRNFKSFHAEKFRQDIKKFVEQSSFSRKMYEKDLNAAFNSWLTSVQKAADKHAPYKTFKPKRDQNHIPWFNRELQDITKTKNMFLKLYRLFRKPDDREKYKAAKNKQTHLKKKYKSEYYTKRINEYKGDPKKMWSILKDVTNNNYRENVTPDIINEETANRFNNYFATVGVKVQEQLKIMIEKPKLNHHGVFKFKPETKEKILQLINRIKSNVATGQDGLSTRLIKEAAPAISEDLMQMVNLSYETKTFPDQLKIATVKALHKKGDNNNPAQYRPISILTIVSKIFERSAVDQLVEYYNSNNLLNPRQHAYRKFHSTITSLFELVETIKSHVDNGNLVAIALLDLSKAFDSLAHNLILKKLDKMGLNETATAWIHSYLCNRKQLVKFGDKKSTLENVKSGVPQGSILGPLLFITCTNDILEELAEYDIFTYADDMQIVVKGKSVENLGKQLESAIKKANEYYNKNSLLCNPTKTEVMLIGTKQRLSNCQQLQVEVSNEEETKILVGEKSLKLLGVHIDQSLDWNKNTSEIKKRATNSIRNLHRINQLIPLKARRTLYSSLVTPHFSYGDTIWGNCGAANRNKLQLAQNYAAKSMLGISKFSSSTQALKKLELLPLAEKRNINFAVQVKKSLLGKSPVNIHQLYVNQLSKENSRAATRGDLNFPKHKLQQYQEGPLYTSIKTWNSIPPELRANDLTNFKRKLQSFKTKQYLEM